MSEKTNAGQTPLLTKLVMSKPGMWKEWKDRDFHELENLARQLERDRAALMRAMIEIERNLGCVDAGQIRVVDDAFEIARALLSKLGDK